MVTPAIPTQANQGMPQLGTPMVNEDGTLSLAWYRFMISLWQRVGQAFTTAVQTVVVQQTSNNTSGLPLNAVNAATGEVIGQFALTGGKGGAAQPVNVGVASPFTYTAVTNGTLIVYGANVEISRDAGVTFIAVSPQGGAIPMLSDDIARLTWYNAPPPTTFLPD